MRELSRQTNCSASLISQIELGKIAPSVSTLYALTSLLGVSMDSLFVTEDRARRGTGRHGPSRAPADLDCLRRRARRGASCSAAPAGPTSPLSMASDGSGLTRLPSPGAEFLEILYDVGGGTVSGDKAIRHNGREYGLVLEGVLSVQIGFETYILEAGDSVAFDSTVPHRFWNGGDVPVRAVWFELKPEWPEEPPGPATLRHSRCTRRPPLRGPPACPAPVRQRPGIRPASGPVRIPPIFLRNASVWRHSRCRADGGWLAFDVTGRVASGGSATRSRELSAVLRRVPAKRQRGRETAGTGTGLTGSLPGARGS